MHKGKFLGGNFVEDLGYTADGGCFNLVHENSSIKVFVRAKNMPVL